jgi:hypothetical protein
LYSFRLCFLRGIFVTSFSALQKNRGVSGRCYIDVTAVSLLLGEHLGRAQQFFLMEIVGMVGIVAMRRDPSADNRRRGSDWIFCNYSNEFALLADAAEEEQQEIDRRAATKRPKRR